MSRPATHVLRLAEALLLATLLPAGAAQEQMKQSDKAPCLEPAPLGNWEDYDGPLKKVVGAFGRKLERKSAVPPHYKHGAVLCSLEVRDKFKLFVRDTVDPISFLTAGFDAGLDQAADRDPSLGQGALGYAKRFGINYAGQTTRRFFIDFTYPAVFSEDPRYYRLGSGSGWRRLSHAAMHTFVAHRDDGRHMFNYSEWLGTASAVAINNTYHPGNKHGFAPVSRQVGYSVLGDMGFDVLREFWPEIARKCRIPFRDVREKPRLEAHP